MDSGDRGLQLERTDWSSGKCALDQRNALADLRAVPQRSVLLGEGDECAVMPGAGGSPSIREQHQRQKSGHCIGSWQVVVPPPAQADRRGGNADVDQSGATGAGVTLGEEQAQRLSGGGGPVGHLSGSPNGEPGTNLSESTLGPADP